MAKFDVYVNPSKVGYLLDLQTYLLGPIASRVVAPLMPMNSLDAISSRLDPVFEIDGVEHILLTQSLTAVDNQLMGGPAVSLFDHLREMSDALDMLFQGF